MRNGIKLFQSFQGLFLEARIGINAKETFLQSYRVRAGETAEQKEAFYVRTKNGWPGAVDLRTYFEAPEWVVESLRKLGFRIVKRQIDMDKYEGGLREYTWKVCSSELFWWLVDYGYKVGKNNPIPFITYTLTQEMKTIKKDMEAEKTVKTVKEMETVGV